MYKPLSCAAFKIKLTTGSGNAGTCEEKHDRSRIRLRRKAGVCASALRVEVSRSHTAGRTAVNQCLILLSIFIKLVHISSPASSPPSIAMSLLRLPSSSPYICFHTYEFSAAFHLLELFYHSFYYFADFPQFTFPSFFHHVAHFLL